MNPVTRLILPLLLAHGWTHLSGCSNPAPVGETAVAESGRDFKSPALRQLTRTMGDLLPVISHNETPLSPKEIDILKSETRRLEGLVHEIKLDAAVSGLAAVRVIPSGAIAPDLGWRDLRGQLSLPSDEVRAAQLSIYRKSWKSARERLRRLTQLCLHCHPLETGDFKPPQFGKMNILERVNTYLLGGQPDAAYDELLKSLNDKQWAIANPEIWNQGVEKLLFIILIWKHDQDLAQETLRKYFETQGFPQDRGRVAAIWKKQIETMTPDLKTEEKGLKGPLMLARNMLDTASTNGRAVGTKAALESQVSAGLIARIRAAMLIHEFLLNQNPNEDPENAYYLAGLTAEGLKLVMIWDSSPDFYSRCIDQSPHSDLSRRCMERLEILRATDRKMGASALHPFLMERREMARLKELAK